MTKLLKHMSNFGALLTPVPREPALGFAAELPINRTQVCREEIVELFKDKLR